MAFFSAYEPRELDLKMYLGLYFIFMVPNSFAFWSARDVICHVLQNRSWDGFVCFVFSCALSRLVT